MILIIILMEFYFVIGYRLRIDQVMYFQDQRNLSLEFIVEQGQRPLVLLHSYTTIQIESNNSLIQIGDNDDHSEQCDDTSKCVYTINVRSDSFSILVKLYLPIIYNDIFNELFPNDERIRCIEFLVDEESLIIIRLLNIFLLLDPFSFRLGKLNLEFEEIAFQHKNIQTLFMLLQKGRFLLFVIGPQNMLYQIQLQTDQLIQDHIVFLKKMDQKRFIYPQVILNLVYLSLYLGSCDLLLNDGHIELQKGITYIIAQEIVQLKQKSDVLLLFYSESIERPSHYEPILIIINTINLTSLLLQSHNPIYLIQDNTSAILEIQTLYFTDYQYKILIPSYQQILKLRVLYKDIVLDQDIEYLYLPQSSKITCIFDTNTYQSQTIYGNFQNTLMGNGILLTSDQPYLIRFSKILQLHFIHAQLNSVYKFKHNVYILLSACNRNRIYIQIFPQDLVCEIYQDSKLRIVDHDSNCATIQFKETRQYKYILIRSQSPFYIEFRSNPYLPFFEMWKSTSVLINPHYIDLAQVQQQSTLIISPKRLNFSFLNTNVTKTKEYMHQIQGVVCLLFNQILNPIQIFENEFLRIENSYHYILYIQSDQIILILQQYSVTELLIEISNTEIQAEVQLSNVNIDRSQLICFNGNIFFITLNESHKYLDLTYCECSKRDCIVRLSPIQSRVDLTYSTCKPLAFGLIQIQQYIFFCDQLEKFDIFQYQGSIKIYRQENFIECLDEICYILVFNHRSVDDLLNYQYEFILVLNQIKQFNNSPLKFLFYNNATQMLNINTNKQYKLFSYQNELITSINGWNNQALEQGYYYLEFSEQVQYVSVFTYPTLLYQGVVFNVYNSQQFTIPIECKVYALFDFIQFSEILIQFQVMNHSITEKYYTLDCNTLSEKVSIKGNGAFQVSYVDQKCFFKSYPQVQLLHNLVILIQFELNEDCDLEYIGIRLNDLAYVQKHCINCLINIEKQPYNQSSQIQYNVTIKSKQFTYEFYFYSQIMISTNNHLEIFYATLLFVIIWIYYIISWIDKVKKANIGNDDRSLS